MISYIVGRNLGHLSSCMAVMEDLQKWNNEKVRILAYKTCHPWIKSNIKSKRVKVKPFSRSILKLQVADIMEKSDLIFHDWREEVGFIKKVQNMDSPIIAGMYHSELQIRHADDVNTLKCKMQVQEMANRTTNIFFHMNLLQPNFIPTLKTKYVPIPIVARQPQLTVEQVKKKLGIAKNEPYIVVQMGGGTGPYKYKYIEQWYEIINKLRTDYHIVVANQLAGVDYKFRKNIRIAPLFSNGVDLIQAAEMVISKPGRGIVNDCIAMKKPLLLLPADTKERFVQNMMIKRLISKDLCEASKKMDHHDLRGRIEEVIGGKEQYEKVFSAIPTNGAEIVAQSISILSGSRLDQLEEKYHEILEITPFRTQ